MYRMYLCLWGPGIKRWLATTTQGAKQTNAMCAVIHVHQDVDSFLAPIQQCSHMSPCATR